MYRPKRYFPFIPAFPIREDEVIGGWWLYNVFQRMIQFSVKFEIMQWQVLVPIGFGTEEIEAVVLIDVLRRAGAEVTVASVEPQLQVEASSGVKLVADTCISNCCNEIFDLVALPVSYWIVELLFLNLCVIHLLQPIQKSFINDPKTISSMILHCRLPEIAVQYVKMMC